MILADIKYLRNSHIYCIIFYLSFQLVVKNMRFVYCQIQEDKCNQTCQNCTKMTQSNYLVREMQTSVIYHLNIPLKTPMMPTVIWRVVL